MDAPELSIIVPVYNTEKYLEKCIYSLLSQEFKSYEIILINDGSSDKSGEICDLFAKKNSNVRVFHQDNLGVSVARNRGLQEAKGKYVTFVDSDDFISPEMYKQLINALTINHADLACCNVDYHTEDGHKIKEKKNNLPDIMSEKDFMAHIFDRPRTIRGSVINKIFCRHKILQFFDESITMAEDILFLVNYCINCRKIVYMDEAYYHIRERNNSLSRNNNQDPTQGLRVIGELISLMETIDSDLRDLAESDYLDNCLQYEGKDYRLLKNYIKSNFFKTMMNPAIKFKFKILCLFKVFL